VFVDEKTRKLINIDELVVDNEYRIIRRIDAKNIGFDPNFKYEKELESHPGGKSRRNKRKSRRSRKPKRKTRRGR
jgi:hypothetical protein